MARTPWRYYNWRHERHLKKVKKAAHYSDKQRAAFWKKKYFGLLKRRSK